MKTQILNNAHILGQNNMAANVLKPSRDDTARGLLSRNVQLLYNEGTKVVSTTPVPGRAVERTHR